jgi:hypothetical protein
MSAVLVREVRQDGRPIARLRCFDAPEGGSIVEADVVPATGGAPLQRGPYRFANAHEAFRFIQEALLTLQYLGCTVDAAA